MDPAPGIQVFNAKLLEGFSIRPGIGATSIARVLEPAFQQVAQVPINALHAAYQTPLNTPVGNLAVPLNWLGGFTALAAVGKAVHFYMTQNPRAEQLEKMAEELSIVKQENEKLHKQNTEIVDTLMSRFQTIVEQQNQEHKRQIEELVEYYEGELKKNETKGSS